MPRHSRVVIPDYPHHVIQRGHNRQLVFLVAKDYRYYLNTLQEWKQRFGCKLFAYCLMTNHVHLVIDPGDDPKSLSLLMKRVAARQTRFVNTRERRCGTLWESRFKSSPIDTDNYLLACCRYVEMNPVRAGIVAVPEEYPWSSCRCRVGSARSTILDDMHDGVCFERDGTEKSETPTTYSAWLRAATPPGELELMRKAVQRGQLTGDDCFSDEIERRIGRRIALRGPGRPRK